MNTETIRNNSYGYATVTPCADGTWTVDRYTDKPVVVMGCSITHQEQRTGLTETAARDLATEWAAFTPAPAPRRYCHWCGLPLTRRGCCEECGEQF